jgi:signal transduction histidine kinase
MVRRFSVKARFALVFAGLLLAIGALMLVLEFLLVRAALPTQTEPDEPGVPATSPSPSTSSVVLGGPDQGRAAAQVVQHNIAEYRADVLNTLAAQSGIALAASVVLALGLGWVAAHRMLRPVQQVTATARRLGADNLRERIRMPGPRDELTELADTFDGMLDRLAESFDSQRRFVANASHELRTPLATQRTMIEVAMAKIPPGSPARRLCERLLTVNARNEQLIDGLLVLASSDRGLRARTDVRLDEVARQAVAVHRASAAQRGCTLHVELKPCVVRGDRLLLERLVGNLIDNALKYNTEPGSVWIGVGERPSLSVANTGPDVPADAVPGLFEPFRQLAGDRAGPQRGVGLGLSIVASVVRAHDGTIEAVPRAGGGLVVVIDFAGARVPDGESARNSAAADSENA